MKRVYILERTDRAALKIGSGFYPDVRAYDESRKRGPVRLLAHAEAPNGIRDERAVQRLLSDYRVGRTEWFTAEDPDALLGHAVEALAEVCGTGAVTVDGRTFPLFRVEDGRRVPVVSKLENALSSALALDGEAETRA